LIGQSFRQLAGARLPTRLVRVGAVIAVGLVAGTLSPSTVARARDLVVFGEPTLAPALRVLGEHWRKQTGIGVRVFASRTELALAQADRQIRCDLIVGLAGPAFEQAEKQETIDAESKAPFADNTLVLIAARDAVEEIWKQSDIAALLAGKRLAIADPDRDLAGRYGLEALRKAGIAIDPASKSIAVAESSAGVVAFLAENRADIGIVYATDAKQSGLRNVKALPEDSYPRITYLVAAVDQPQANPDDFREFLKSADAGAVLREAGLRIAGP
jgi:molybdate transport system substrate-binding protein